VPVVWRKFPHRVVENEERQVELCSIVLLQKTVYFVSRYQIMLSNVQSSNSNHLSNVEVSGLPIPPFSSQDKLSHHEMETRLVKWMHAGGADEQRVLVKWLILDAYKKGATELSLFKCKLRDLPPEIGHLDSLLELDLLGNQLKTLPPEMANLKNLKKLDLGENAFNHLPEVIGKLENLITLYLDGNPLETLPETLKSFWETKEFDFAEAQADVNDQAERLAQDSGSDSGPSDWLMSPPREKGGAMAMNARRFIPRHRDDNEAQPTASFALFRRNITSAGGTLRRALNDLHAEVKNGGRVVFVRPHEQAVKLTRLPLVLANSNACQQFFNGFLYAANIRYCQYKAYAAGNGNVNAAKILQVANAACQASNIPIIPLVSKAAEKLNKQNKQSGLANIANKVLIFISSEMLLQQVASHAGTLFAFHLKPDLELGVFPAKKFKEQLQQVYKTGLEKTKLRPQDILKDHPALEQARQAAKRFLKVLIQEPPTHLNQSDHDYAIQLAEYLVAKVLGHVEGGKLPVVDIHEVPAAVYPPVVPEVLPNPALATTVERLLDQAMRPLKNQLVELKEDNQTVRDYVEQMKLSVEQLKRENEELKLKSLDTQAHPTFDVVADPVENDDLTTTNLPLPEPIALAPSFDFDSANVLQARLNLDQLTRVTVKYLRDFEMKIVKFTDDFWKVQVQGHNPLRKVGMWKPKWVNLQEKLKTLHPIGGHLDYQPRVELLQLIHTHLLKEHRFHVDLEDRPENRERLATVLNKVLAGGSNSRSVSSRANRPDQG
jgi:Leucine-rich repeat (LRR) protein/FtsZ-binding cell division protein ZapB